MRRCFRNVSNKSQALSELAIFGTLLIIGFGAMISYVQSMNSQQSLQMEAFRKAFRLSKTSGKEISYTIIKDSPVIDIGDLFGRPDTTRVTASSTIWASPKSNGPKNAADLSSREYYEVNQQVFSINPVEVNIQFGGGDDRDVWVPAPIADMEFRTRKERAGAITKEENAAAITTRRSGSVNAFNTTNLVLQNQADFEREYLEDAQDPVDTEPWERDLRSDMTTAKLKLDLDLLIAGLAGQVFGSGCGFSAATLTSMIYNSVFNIFDDLLSYFMDEGDPPDNTPTSIRVIRGYRGRDAVSGTNNFIEPQPAFTVTP